eukprot:4471587-Pyramimonas_sp.AAC.2
MQGGKVVFFAAAMGVVFDRVTNKQSFVTDNPESEGIAEGNTDDIVSMARHPNKVYKNTPTRYTITPRARASRRATPTKRVHGAPPQQSVQKHHHAHEALVQPLYHWRV